MFRHHYALPSALDSEGREVAAVRGVLASILKMIEDGATHIAVATDHVIESFRNAMWPGYKTGEGIEPALLTQFPILEDALRALGVVVWPMIEFEADDALASGAIKAAGDPSATRIIICTPDKDLAQCVRGDRIVQLDRRKNLFRNEEDVKTKFGVSPASIPDYLALVGDAADGYPGLRGWGAKSSAALLARYGRLEDIPPESRDWDVNVASAKALAQTLNEQRELAFLFRDLATLRMDIPLFDTLEELQWNGPTSGFPALAAKLDHSIRSSDRGLRSAVSRQRRATS